MENGLDMSVLYKGKETVAGVWIKRWLLSALERRQWKIERSEHMLQDV